MNHTKVILEYKADSKQTIPNLQANRAQRRAHKKAVKTGKQQTVYYGHTPRSMKGGTDNWC